MAECLSQASPKWYRQGALPAPLCQCSGFIFHGVSKHTYAINTLEKKPLEFKEHKGIAYARMANKISSLFKGHGSALDNIPKS